MDDYIEFEVNDSAKFTSLQTVFQKIKDDKEKGFFEDWDFYLKHFDDEAKSHFNNSEWDVEGMIASIEDAEYKLVSCKMISNDRARLEFLPFSSPFGGTGGLEVLIESFGFVITEIEYL